MYGESEECQQEEEGEGETREEGVDLVGRFIWHYYNSKALLPKDPRIGYWKTSFMKFFYINNPSNPVSVNQT